MYTLILLRHAKAVKSTGDDFSRILTNDGGEDALRAGTALRDRGLAPDLALVSPSARTRQTFEAVRSATERDIGEVRYPDALYNGTSQVIRDLVGAVDPAMKCVMVVGHNPGIAEGVATLARDGARAAIDSRPSGLRPS